MPALLVPGSGVAPTELAGGWGTWEGPRGTGACLGWLVSSFPCLFSIMGLGMGVPCVPLDT